MHVTKSVLLNEQNGLLGRIVDVLKQVEVLGESHL
jgi:hypothetical protein